jgi:hypothetical protein
MHNSYPCRMCLNIGEVATVVQDHYDNLDKLAQDVKWRLDNPDSHRFAKQAGVRRAECDVIGIQVALTDVEDISAPARLCSSSSRIATSRRWMESA